MIHKKCFQAHPTMAAIVASLALLVATSGACLAQDAATGSASGAADAPVKTGKIGPGSPASHAKSSAKSAKAAPAAKGIHLSPVTPVASSVNVHPQVLSECKLQTALPQQIAEKNSEIVLSDAPGAETLELRIVDIHAPNGGWFSGPKWVTVDGKLMAGKTVKGSFTAKETSMASATACGMLSKVIAVMAGDIAEWVKNPTKNGTLGGAH
ncbi:MAG TPA: hypothetical protein VGK20_03060 [Candidatus Binatia bacterium]|jgi:hypothetical protein